MPLDPSIASGGTPIQIQDPMNRMAALLQAQGLQQSNQLNGMKIQQQQIANDRQNKLYSIMGNLPADATDEQRSAALKGAGFFDQADVIDKNAIARQTAAAQGAKDRADALAKFVGVQKDLSTAVMENPTVENATAALTRAAQYHKMLGFGDLDTSGELAAVQGMTSPDQIKQWAAGHALNAEKLLPTVQKSNLGGSTITQSIDPVTGKPTLVDTQTNTVSPDTVATTVNQLKLEGIRQAGENSRAKLSRDTQLTINGLNSDGTFNTNSGIQGIVDSIGNYTVPESTALGRMPPGVKGQVLAELAKQYPSYDPTRFASNQKIINDFATGSQQKFMQAGNTVLNHLGTIQELALAQKNGDIPLFNKLANAYAQQTGSPVPTNLKAAITLAAPEITKAITGSAGAVDDRLASAAVLDPNASPEQTLGSIATIQDLFGGRLQEAGRTYGLTGRQDFATKYLSPAAQKVLAAKQGTSSPTGVPSDIAALLAKHGGK